MFARFNVSVVEFPEANVIAQEPKDFGRPYNADGIQLRQFFDNGFDGSRDTARTLSVAISAHEAGPFELGHYGFFDWYAQNAPSNILSALGCHPNGLSLPYGNYFEGDCIPDAIPGYGSGSFGAVDLNISEHQHASSMAGKIFGNVIQGQDQRLPSNEYSQFSGHTDEAVGHLVYTDVNAIEDAIGIDRNTQQGYEILVGQLGHSAGDLYDQLIGAYRRPSVLNISQGDGRHLDPNCLGGDTWSRSVNSVYEYGILPIKSAGNQLNITSGLSDPNEEQLGPYEDERCTVTAPGAAVGAFTVGQHGVTGGGSCNSGYPVAGPCGDMFFNGDIGSTTAQGAHDFTSGRGRTIVDLVTQDRYIRDYLPELLYNIDDSLFGIGSPKVTRGTSSSAAAVSGFAANLLPGTLSEGRTGRLFDGMAA